MREFRVGVGKRVDLWGSDVEPRRMRKSRVWMETRTVPGVAGLSVDLQCCGLKLNSPWCVTGRGRDPYPEDLFMQG